MIDAALTHLIETHENLEDVRHQHLSDEIKAIANTSVLGLKYRTSVESNWE